MPKFLKDAEFAKLQSSANNYDAIVAAAREADPELAENASAEDLLSAISSASATEPVGNEDLKNQITALTEKNTELQNQVTSQAEQIKTLSKSPASPVTAPVVQQEPTSQKKDDAIEAICKEHANDPVAMAAAMAEAGLV